MQSFLLRIRRKYLFSSTVVYVISVFFHDRAYKVSFSMNIFIYLHSKSVQGYTRLIDDLQYALARNYSHVRGSLGDGLCSCRTVCQQPHVTHLPLYEVSGTRAHFHQFVVSATITAIGIHGSLPGSTI